MASVKEIYRISIKSNRLNWLWETEIPHTRQTRGVYRTIGTRKPWDKDEVLNEHDAARVFPLTSFTTEEVFDGIDTRYASSYDNQTRRISVREQWKQTRDNDFFIGQFVWTGLIIWENRGVGPEEPITMVS